MANGAAKTRGAFYDHFLNKEDLFLSIFEDLFAPDTESAGAFHALSKRSQDMLLLELWLYALRMPAPNDRLRQIHVVLAKRGVLLSGFVALPALEFEVA